MLAYFWSSCYNVSLSYGNCKYGGLRSFYLRLLGCVVLFFTLAGNLFISALFAFFVVFFGKKSVEGATDTLYGSLAYVCVTQCRFDIAMS